MRRFYGIGVGPGDPELITLKAINTIKKCDYVFIPKNKNMSTARNIATEYIRDKKIIELEFPMGEDNSKRYEENAKVIYDKLKLGQTAVFLTLGDPMTYSTYIYLMSEMQRYDISIETIPGITSFAAATSKINLPLTLKDESFYLCDGNLDTEILRKVETVCILKVNKKKKEIMEILENENFEYHYVKRVTRDDEKILQDKEEILKDDDYMSLIIGRKK